MRDHVVGTDVARFLEPELGRRRQHMTLVWHRCQYMVKRGLAVGRDHHAAAVRQIVAFADLAALVTGQFAEFGVRQHVLQAPLVEFAVCHGRRV